MKQILIILLFIANTALAQSKSVQSNVFKGSKPALVSVNGTTYSTNSVQSVTISEDGVFINGKAISIDQNAKTISVIVTGNAERINVQAGTVEVKGNVTGSVETMSGDIICNSIGGDAETMSGDIIVNPKQ